MCYWILGYEKSHWILLSSEVPSTTHPEHSCHGHELSYTPTCLIRLFFLSAMWSQFRKNALTLLWCGQLPVFLQRPFLVARIMTSGSSWPLPLKYNVMYGFLSYAPHDLLIKLVSFPAPNPRAGRVWKTGTVSWWQGQYDYHTPVCTLPCNRMQNCRQLTLYSIASQQDVISHENHRAAIWLAYM